MEEQGFSMESLYEKAKAYTDTTLELAKLKAVDKSSDLISTLVPRLTVIMMLLIVIFCMNIALALWLGTLTGQAYFGFLLVAGFYSLLALFMHFFLHTRIKKRIADAFIANLLS